MSMTAISPLSGQSKASFTDLTLVGTLKATDSTLEANTLINTGEMSLAGAQVSLHGSEQTASRLGTVWADNDDVFVRQGIV